MYIVLFGLNVYSSSSASMHIVLDKKGCAARPDTNNWPMTGVGHETLLSSESIQSTPNPESLFLHARTLPSLVEQTDRKLQCIHHLPCKRKRREQLHLLCVGLQGIPSLMARRSTRMVVLLWARCPIKERAASSPRPKKTTGLTPPRQPPAQAPRAWRCTKQQALCNYARQKKTCAQTKAVTITLPLWPWPWPWPLRAGGRVPPALPRGRCRSMLWLSP